MSRVCATVRDRPSDLHTCPVISVAAGTYPGEVLFPRGVCGFWSPGPAAGTIWDVVNIIINYIITRKCALDSGMRRNIRQHVISQTLWHRIAHWWSCSCRTTNDRRRSGSETCRNESPVNHVGTMVAVAYFSPGRTNDARNVFCCAVPCTNAAQRSTK